MRTRSMQVDEEVGRLVVVSDLHGFTEPLGMLDGIIAAYPERVQVVAAGDYVASGLEPAETVEWVRRNAGQFAVIGNHDEGAITRAEGEHPPWTERGSSQRLSPEQREYLSELPDSLDLFWKGRLIRITHGRMSSGEWINWLASEDEVFEAFADPSVALTITAHTHYPFVRRNEGGCLANSGATSYLVLGMKGDDGTMWSRTEGPPELVPSIYSSYLCVTTDGADLEVAVERFDYDREKEIRGLLDAGRPTMEWLGELIRTGIG